MNATEALQRDYRVAFLRYLSSRDEVPLTIAYELGRRAVADRLSILELSRIHHDTFRLVVLEARPAELDGVVGPRRSSSSRCSRPYHMVHGQDG